MLIACNVSVSSKSKLGIIKGRRLQEFSYKHGMNLILKVVIW